MPSTVSVVMATFNEERMIEKSLRSVAGFAKEIIVVDGSSTDQTVKLAKDAGAQVFSTTNKPNFHINKQMAMDKATGDLVLQLDADEVVDDELASFITQIASDIDGFADNAWYIRRRNFFLGHFLTKGGQYPDPVIRLYKRGQAKLPQRDVHEQMAVTGSVGMAAGHLIHYANPTFTDYLRKFNTYTSFKAEQLLEQKVEVSWFNTWRYIVWLPLQTAFLLFIRHKGFVDGIPGFVFAIMSGLHHAVAYLKVWEHQVKTETKP